MCDVIGGKETLEKERTCLPTTSCFATFNAYSDIWGSLKMVLCEGIKQGGPLTARKSSN